MSHSRLSRETTRRWVPAFARTTTAVALTALIGACSASTNSASGGQGAGVSHTLHTAFSFDQGSLDPDIFYDAEGLSVTLAVYQGLLQYANNSTPTLEPALAENWTESSNGLTYTFHLRPHVLFHDGTPMTSSSWKFDFQRRTGVNGGPAYMVAEVASMSTPDPLTFVVHLKKPVSAFLNYMASPYGPKAISPAAIKAHKTAKAHWAQTWLANHEAGTGPYTLSSVVPGQSYVMTAYPKYWGPKPYYTTVDISQIPSFSTQELELRSGTLNVMLHGVLPADLSQFQNSSSFQIQRFPSIVRLNLWINPHLAPFTNQAVRLAAAQAINRQKIISEVFHNTATVANQMYPTGALPAGTGTFNPTFDPSKLKALASSLPSKHVDLAYTTDDPVNAQVATLVAQDLDAAGLKVTTRGVTEATTFAWPTHPAGRADMLILPANPDDADASAWATLFYAEGGGLSYFEPNVTAADQQINLGLHSVKKNTILAHYETAANLYRESGDFIPLADEQEVAVAQSGITGWSHDFSTLWTVRLWDLKAK